jgi:hypothetical protein
MDERFAVPDFDLEDDDPIAGECFECHRYSRLLDVDMLCPKCAAQQSVQSDLLPCGHDGSEHKELSSLVYGCAICAATSR